MANSTLSETNENVTASSHQEHHAQVDSPATAQGQHPHHAQSVFENGLELFKQQTESTGHLMLTLIEQSHKQQEVFWRATLLSWQTYLDSFSAPFILFRNMAKHASVRKQQEDADFIEREEELLMPEV